MKRNAYRGDYYINLTQLIICGLLLAIEFGGAVIDIILLLFDWKIKPTMGHFYMTLFFTFASYVLFHIVYKEFKEER